MKTKTSRSLRTLKDLYTQDEDELMRNIKEEAIKWVKEKRRLGKEGLIDNRLTFMNFHNITEEDLKSNLEH